MAKIDELLYATINQQLRESRLLPSKKVKIGNSNYKVLTTDYSNIPFHGETFTDNKEICIATKYAPQEVQDTVMHEFLHAIMEDLFESLFPDLDETMASKKEEAFTRLLTPRMLQFIQENPKWIKYLQKKNC